MSERAATAERLSLGARVMRKARYLIRPPNEIERRSRARRWLGNAIFGFVPWTRGPIYAAYHPDSAYIFGAHPERDRLYQRWVRGNRLNNGGDLVRLYALLLNLKRLELDAVDGDFAELGVWRGNSASVLAHFAERGKRRLFLLDTFAGFDQRDIKDVDAERGGLFADTSVDFVR